jgi:predicted flap endonuclease-1-like 5' DNA nuclease
MEELEELEPIDDGEISAVTPAPPRTSVPPPIPKHALERTSVGVRPSPLISHGSMPPPLRSSIPPQRSSLPSAPPPSGLGSTPPSSGIYRVAESKSDSERWQDVVRELELKVRLRDDLIAELKRSIEEQKKQFAAAEARAAAAVARAVSAEARTSEAEARASSAEERASSAEERASSAEERASSAEASASAAPAASGDDLKRIKGIGPAFERKLHALGVSSFSTIAAWTEADIERIAEALAILPQRITRDRWIEKAQKLSQ